MSFSSFFHWKVKSQTHTNPTDRVLTLSQEIEKLSSSSRLMKTQWLAKEQSYRSAIEELETKVSRLTILLG